MSKYNRISYLASCGDQAIAAAGLTLYSSDSDFLPIRTGQLVIYDPKTNLTLAVGDIATADHIAVGIGIGQVGGSATEVQHISKESIDLCETSLRATVSSPVCGVGQVVDVYLNGCMTCEGTYSIVVNLDDAYARYVYELNDPAPYVFTITPDCCDNCDSCETSVDKDDMVCKFVDLINGTVQLDPAKITRFQNSKLTNQYQPFRAAKLFLADSEDSALTNWSFCFTSEDSSCADCDHLAGVTGITIDGKSTDFVNTTRAGDETVTDFQQMKNLVEQANKALDAIGGSAYLDHGIGKCCSWCIKINTCAAEVKFNTSEVDVFIEGTRSNPFQDFDTAPICRGCGADDTTITPTYGFRLYVEPIEVPCSKEWPPNLPVPTTYVRRLDVQKWGEGWPCTSFLTTEVTAQVLPEGFGYYWQDMAHTGRHRGGKGKDWRYNNQDRGRIGLPDAKSISSSLPACLVCDEQYCVYNIESVTTKGRKFNNAPLQQNLALDYILVPKKDTVAQTAIQTVLNALNARGSCVGGTVVCA
jgi:hypothetical protein